MMMARQIGVAYVLSVVVCSIGAAGQAEWQPVAQPDLQKQLKAAKPLQVENICTPARTANTAVALWIPNPDGETYDVLESYFDCYNDPIAFYMVDLATGEVKKEVVARGRVVGLGAYLFAPDGRLYLTLRKREGQETGVELYVYDPARNELTCKGVIVPGMYDSRYELVVGSDGKISTHSQVSA